MSGDVGAKRPDGQTESVRRRETAAQRMGRRAGLGFVVAIALAFTAASADQIVAGAFEASVRPLPSGPPGSSDRLCADGVSRLARDPDSRVRDAPTKSPRESERAVDASAVGSACSYSSAGLDAWASFLRLEEARRQLPAGSDAELATLRRNVFAHLPAELR